MSDQVTRKEEAMPKIINSQIRVKPLPQINLNDPRDICEQLIVRGWRAITIPFHHQGAPIGEVVEFQFRDPRYLQSPSNVIYSKYAYRVLHGKSARAEIANVSSQNLTEFLEPYLEAKWYVLRTYHNRFRRMKEAVAGDAYCTALLPLNAPMLSDRVAGPYSCRDDVEYEALNLIAFHSRAMAYMLNGFPEAVL
jgi:hypothetical protein